METESKDIDASTTMETESKDIDASNTDNDIESQSVTKNVDDDGKSRTGTMWTASAHIITGIVGSGVLALTWSMAQLGWIGGIAIMVAFSFITYYTSCLLADCYRYPSSTGGKRNVTYMDTVNAYLGKTMLKLCGMFQLIILCGATVGYTITTSISMVAIQKANCFHNRGRGAHCKFSGNWFMIGLGILEIFVSQIPSFHKLAGLSVLAAIMSLAYSLIGFGLALAKVISGDGGATTLTGVEIGPSLTAAGKTWRVFRAIGNMAFAFSFSAILIEIQDTLKPVPPENKVMRKANGVGMLTATALYMSCACLGYAAFGNNAPGNMLTGFGFYEPYWLINLGNIAIVIHLVGAYQVLSQPVFSTVESWASSKWPMSKFVNGEYPLITCNSKSILKINLFRLTWRTAYVVAATVLSMALPFFNEVLSLLGAVAYWPMTVYFPVEMCIVQKKIKRFTIKWIWLELLNLFCLLVSIAAVIGAIEGLERGLSSVKPFQFKQ